MYPSWLEYSIEKDAAYCMYSYLFKPHNEEGGGDAFTAEGFRNWKKIDELKSHVGGPLVSTIKHAKRSIICSIRSRAFKYRLRGN